MSFTAFLEKLSEIPKDLLVNLEEASSSGVSLVHPVAQLRQGLAICLLGDNEQG